MKKTFVSWGESYLYTPSLSQKLLSYLLTPLSLLYFFIVTFKYRSAKAQDLGIKVVSVGNVVVGGSGKTPLVTALVNYFLQTKKVAIVLRGYGRKSSGLVVVSDAVNLLCDVAESGDEAMIYAKKLPSSVVIVSEDRVAGINRAKELACEVVFLDDGYSKHTIKKLDLLIEVETNNHFFLPAGPYRDRVYEEKELLKLVEGKDFQRVVQCLNVTKKMALVTAIARPQRLEKYLCVGVVGRHYFEDHHNFTYDEVKHIYESERVDSLLVTLKDFVKLEQYDIPLSLMDLEVNIDEKIIKKVKDYLEKED